jgi:hypothetical protein
MNIHLMGTELFHPDGHRHEEVNSFCNSANTRKNTQSFKNLLLKVTEVIGNKLCNVTYSFFWENMLSSPVT